MSPIPATQAGPSFFNQGEGPSSIPRLSVEEFTNRFSSFIHLFLNTNVCAPTMVPTEANNLIGPELAHANEYQSSPVEITTSAMAIISFFGHDVPTIVTLTLAPPSGDSQCTPSLDQGTEPNQSPSSHLSQSSQSAMGHSTAAGSTTMDPHLECAPPPGSIPIDPRNPAPQPREPYHYQPSAHGDTTQELVAGGAFTSVAASPGETVDSLPFNQVSETCLQDHSSSFSPVNSDIIPSAPPAYQGEGHWLSASQQLGQIRQGPPYLSTTAGPIGVVGVDQYPSYGNYQPFRLDDTTQEPIPPGTTTAGTDPPGVHSPQFNSTPGANSWYSASGHQSSPSPVNSAVVAPVPAYPNEGNGLYTSQQFPDQTYQDTSTLSTTAGPSRDMAVDQQPSHYGYPSGHGDTTHEQIMNRPHTAATASPGGVVCPPSHVVFSPPDHPPVNRDVIPPAPTPYQNEGNGQSTSQQLCQTYQGTPTSSTTPEPIPGVSADQRPRRFKCPKPKCSARFIDNSARNRHLKDKHGPKMVCPDCKSQFPRGRKHKFTEHRQTCPGP